MKTATRTIRPTLPLPPAAVQAMHRIELALSAPESVRKAVARYKANAARYDELMAKPAASLSAAEFDAIGSAQQNLAEQAGILADAGMFFLVKAV
jgi:hypothetical protein